jgi:alkanesulfonate monooxygenase SsuD/methylene tetrahydromethanopterin reductase-like flavin-dependent oxidoreductase (luciferase family)
MPPKNKQFTFGIAFGPLPPWQSMLEQAKLVETLGFDKLFVPDHFVAPEQPQAPWYESWTALSALAPFSEKIVLGTMVASMTLRNPALLARMAMTLDHITGGRFELGVGSAGSPACHSMTGIPNWERRDRSERYREFVEILDQMLVNDVTSYHGRYYDIQTATMLPRPLAQPRLILNVAAHGPKALRLAGTYGDAWNSCCPGKDLTPEQSSSIIRQWSEQVSEYAVAAGRDPTQIGRTFLFGWSSDRLFRSMEAFYDTIGRYREAGIDDFIFAYAPGIDYWKEKAITTVDLLEQVALEAIPRLRQETFSVF